MALLEYAVVNYSFYGRRRMLSRQRHSQMLEKSEESHDYSDSYGSRIRTCRDSSAGERTLRQRSVPNGDVPQLTVPKFLKNMSSKFFFYKCESFLEFYKAVSQRRETPASLQSTFSMRHQRCLCD